MSLSLHSSIDALTSSKRGLEKDRLIEPEKSSIGEISPRISSRPDWSRTTVPASALAERSRQASLPTSQSKDSVCGTGVSMNPNEFTRPKLDSDPIRPMFGPSGVSIGHMRP